MPHFSTAPPPAALFDRRPQQVAASQKPCLIIAAATKSPAQLVEAARRLTDIHGLGGRIAWCSLAVNTEQPIPLPASTAPGLPARRDDIPAPLRPIRDFCERRLWLILLMAALLLGWAAWRFREAPPGQDGYKPPSDTPIVERSAIPNAIPPEEDRAEAFGHPKITAENKVENEENGSVPQASPMADGVPASP